MTARDSAVQPTPSGATRLPDGEDRCEGRQQARTADGPQTNRERAGRNVVKPLKRAAGCQEHDCPEPWGSGRFRPVEPRTQERIEHLLDEIRAGSEKARNAVLAWLRPYMVRAAGRLLPNRIASADDAVQEAQRRCFPLLAIHDRAERLRRWACHIARHEALRVLQCSRRLVIDESALEAGLVERALKCSSDIPLGRDIDHAVAVTDARDLTILSALAAGRTHEEIAVEFAMPVGGVADRVRPARMRFAERLGLTELVEALATKRPAIERNGVSQATEGQVSHG